MSVLGKITLKILEKRGYGLVKKGIVSKNGVPVDMEPAFAEIYQKCRPFTMICVERMYAIFKATEYVLKAKIPGDFVECGVWRGGAAMLMALTIKHLGHENRRIWLYDTFAGMTEPTDVDRRFDGRRAAEQMAGVIEKSPDRAWCFASLDEVRQNMARTGYPLENQVFVKGKVEETIPGNAPEKIALLHLDTDWYDSTKHELEHLFPRLEKYSPLLIDDYGHWQGSRRAVDEFFDNQGLSVLLNRTDYSGRTVLKW